eukprot:TRINITY_DN12321_c1_g1_i2.p1 TRINITY_DN12321_c1_g1~~TRINITY_DN12321_c1_g1_i2.p1  ORF type:complete len:414 (+),score=98.13 TRINITY_DN12321_c1_g1_i2:1701-2942(+)
MENSLLDVEFPSLLPSAMSLWGGPGSPDNSSGNNSQAASVDGSMMTMFQPSDVGLEAFLGVADTQFDLPPEASSEAYVPKHEPTFSSPSSQVPDFNAKRPPRKTTAVSYQNLDDDDDAESKAEIHRAASKRRPKRIRPPPSAKRKARHQMTESKRRERINTAVELLRNLVQCDPKAEKAIVLEMAAAKLAQLLNNANPDGQHTDAAATNSNEQAPPPVQASPSSKMDVDASRTPSSVTRNKLSGQRVSVPDVNTLQLPTAFKEPLDEALRKTLVISETSLCSPALQQALMLVSPSCHIIDCSLQFCQVMGLDKAEVLGRSAQRLLPDPDVGIVGGPLIALFTGKLDNLSIVSRIGFEPNYIWAKCVFTRIDSSVTLQELYQSSQMVGQASTQASVMVIVEAVAEPDEGAQVLT